MFVFGFAFSVCADETTVAKSQPAAPTLETWTGAEGFRNVLSFYGGVTWAPNGTLHSEGFRLRVAGGGSRFTSIAAFSCRVGALIEECSQEFAVMRTYAHALVGWQAQFGATTIKTFAGLAYANESLSSDMTHRRLAGPRFGPSAAVEVWHEFSPWLWASLDLAFARPDFERSVRLRTGFRTTALLSIGPEAQVAARNDAQLVGGSGIVADAKVGRVQKYGGFFRWDQPGFELSFSGGAVVTPDRPSGLYLSGQYLARF